jgi:hypothetical protein
MLLQNTYLCSMSGPAGGFFGLICVHLDFTGNRGRWSFDLGSSSGGLELDTTVENVSGIYLVNMESCSYSVPSASGTLKI